MTAEQSPSWQFTNEHFEQFEYFERTALGIPVLKDSVEYLFIIEYKLKNFLSLTLSHLLTDKKRPKGQTSIPIQVKYQTDERNDNLAHMTAIVPPEIIPTLSEKQVSFILRLGNLLQMQCRRLQFNQNYATAGFANEFDAAGNSRYLQPPPSSKNKYIWLLPPERIEILFELLTRIGLIECRTAAELGVHFCDSKGTVFGDAEPKPIQWIGKMSELTYTLRSLISYPMKAIDDKDIWLKTSKIFLKNAEQKMLPNTLQASSQSACPKNKEMLDKLIKEVKGINQKQFN